MSYFERIHFESYVTNKNYIESRWSKQWGDRINELVFIGQHIDKEKVLADLDKCLLQEDEFYLFDKNIMFEDPFPTNI